MTLNPSTPVGEQAELAVGLRWGIKRSFMDYLGRMPDGRGWAGDGALPIGDSEIFFEFDPDASMANAADGGAVWAFAGDVRFSGHFGMLFVRIARPWVEVDGATATMTVTNPHSEGDTTRLALVTARLEPIGEQDGSRVYVGIDVRLAETAVEVFNDVYPAGEPFEDFVVQLPGLLS